MYEWTDPDTNQVYEIMYNVTQTDEEGPEHFMYRAKDGVQAHLATWTKLPPFVDPSTMRKLFDHFFGPTAGWQHGIKASIVSDIEKIDKALDRASDFHEGENNLVLSDIDAILDALHDARSGLLYLSDQVKDQDERLNKIHGWSTP